MPPLPCSLPCFPIRCRGIPFSTFLPGLAAAVQAAPQRHGLTASLIMCFVRHLGPQAAADTLEEVRGRHATIARRHLGWHVASAKALLRSLGVFG